MSGVITCGLGEGFGVVVLLVEVRLGRGAGLFLGLARLGFGFGFTAFGFGITCPSCCGSTLMLSAKVKASAPLVRSKNLKLLSRLMAPPKWSRQSELWHPLNGRYK